MSKLTLLPALLLLALAALQAQPKTESASLSAARPLELKWSELAPVIGNNKVRIALPDGAVISGETVAVRDDALVIDVKKTSNAALHPKATRRFPVMPYPYCSWRGAATRAPEPLARRSASSPA